MPYESVCKQCKLGSPLSNVLYGRGCFRFLFYTLITKLSSDNTGFPFCHGVTSFWEDACKGKKLTILDFFNVVRRNLHRLIEDSVQVVDVVLRA